MKSYEEKYKVKKWWNTEQYIAHEIVECVDILIERNTGYPNQLTEKKWKKILTDIRDGFKVYFDCEGDFWVWKDGKEPPNGKFVKQKDGFMAYVTPKNDCKLIVDRKNKAKFDKAMKLFAKYFMYLWD